MLVLTKGKFLLSAKHPCDIVKLCRSLSTMNRQGNSRGDSRGRRSRFESASMVFEPGKHVCHYRQMRQQHGNGRNFNNDAHMFHSSAHMDPQQQHTVPQCFVPDYQQECQNQTARQEERLRTKLRSMRHWDYTELGKKYRRKEKPMPEQAMPVTVMSYNVLAQELLEQHGYLYEGISRDVLDWDLRSQRILRDLKDSKADVLCLQEVQASHFDTFYCPRLKRMGYNGLFKKRTGDKPDGCAVFYRTSKFKLHFHKTVEYYKPSVKILNRDNIGLIVLLSPHSHPSNSQEQPLLCVANTHLLYNPRRHDVKLAQLQVLFAELDHVAFDGSQYHPVILTGDFNLSPDSSVYRFITNGSLDYGGLSHSPELIPQKLRITDQCQHLDILEKRQNDGVYETLHYTFSSGALSHKLKFRSAYPHRIERLQGSPPEVTTHQDDWLTVDYIFYNTMKKDDGKTPYLSPLRRLRLLSGAEMESLGGIPNLAAPSDHVPLVASFLWQW